MQKSKPTEAKTGDKTTGKKDDEIVVIKKYANRRLYNTATSSYVTLDHLCQMVKDGVDFVVYDAKAGDDITRSVLTQIIVEEESKGTNLLPISFLRQLIGYYGDNMEWMVPRYLEHMMASLQKNQEQMRQSMQDTLGGMFPFGNIEEMSKQNVAFFESAMKMFSPFAGDEKGQQGQPPTTDSSDDSDGPDDDQLQQLRRQVEALQQQLQSISRGKK
ncbi:polyhydroxyalkanoate synthesis repressor PhaR [Limibacillus halophilus]|uniref:Polyhydroxyalkanoate synthesis repressor PhaR n=1 Tax=Limibacillus halophilus TaxID=1579333 RepID=A0A839SYH6_9PROT|nr:polyhydroxyalkanoate synthesis repressor PhaR [Limibacillus halophilus]MBB3066616.1 polyhydroxyalkanoate synthesis repressor PhaR [Limibacillus halophilus]